MSKQKKSSNKKPTKTELILLITAIVELTNKLIDLIEKLVN